MTFEKKTAIWRPSRRAFQEDLDGRKWAARKDGRKATSWWTEQGNKGKGRILEIEAGM